MCPTVLWEMAGLGIHSDALELCDKPRSGEQPSNPHVGKALRESVQVRGPFAPEEGSWPSLI